MSAPAKIETASLASAMALAFGEIEAATKSANNPHFKSKYADLGAVIDAVKPPLIKYGLFFTQRPRPCEGGVSVETVIHHASGETLSLGTLFVPANKNDAQGFGSALTYARRYALQTAFGVPTEDDDGNAASRNVPPPQQAAKPLRDDQFALISTLAPVAGKSLAEICAAYKIDDLNELTEAQGAALVKRLETDAKTATKEPVNA